MTGYEQQLYARAEMLDETGELAAAAGEILSGASGAGVDPAAVIGLRTAVRELDPAGGTPGYQAGSQADRHLGTGYGSDAEFLEAVSDAETAVSDWLGEADRLQEQVIAALDKAHGDLERAQHDLKTARQDLAAACAMPTKEPCGGYHGRKDAAIAVAEAAISDAEGRIAGAARRISICEDAAEILDPLARRLEDALQALRQVPHDLGEVYELVYGFIRGGGKLPHLARWIQGQGAPA
jgi:hypothetical protein